LTNFFNVSTALAPKLKEVDGNNIDILSVFTAFAGVAHKHMQQAIKTAIIDFKNVNIFGQIKMQINHRLYISHDLALGNGI
jgi:hypothetical protein